MFQTPLIYLSRQIHRVFRLPFMLRFKAKYPRAFAFLENRFSFNSFFGFPFTLILLAGWLNLALLTELAENVVNSKEMKAVDASVSLELFDWRRSGLSQAFYLFTQVGNLEGLIIGTSLAAIYMLIKKKWYYLLGLLVSVLGSGLAVNFTKTYFVRERPLDIGYYALTSFSFPSGHATGAVALQGFICYLLIRRAKTFHVQVFWAITGLIYILLIGFSRIYLGVHFLTDVLAGYLLGVLWLLAAVVIMEFAMLKGTNQPEPKLPGTET